MTKPDPFDFDTAALEEKGLDITGFAPTPRRVDRPAVAAAREAARDSGFTRRAAPSTDIAPPSRSRKRRVNITELLGIEDRYPDTERAQLNMLAPVPIVLRWRALVQGRQLPAWEVLEAAMDALEDQARHARAA